MEGLYGSHRKQISHVKFYKTPCIFGDVSQVASLWAHGPVSTSSHPTSTLSLTWYLSSLIQTSLRHDFLTLSSFHFHLSMAHHPFVPKCKLMTIGPQFLFVVVVVQSCLTLCDPKDCSLPGFPVLHDLLELAQTHVH